MQGCPLGLALHEQAVIALRASSRQSFALLHGIYLLVVWAWPPGPEQGRRERFASAEELFLRALPPACDTVLWDPDGLIAAGGMTDEYALRHSEGSRQAQVCYESGLASDRSSVETTRRAVRHCLEQLGLLPGPQARGGGLQRTFRTLHVRARLPGELVIVV